MAIPLIYNLRSLRARWTSTIVAVLGIAGTVGVFIAMLSLARGFEATLVASGSASNAIVRRAGATSEMDSMIALDQVRVIEDAPGVARGGVGALVSSEVVVVAAFPLKSTGTDANVQVRGVSPKALAVRDSMKVVAGRFFEPGLTELVVGRNVASSYVGFELGKTVRFGGGPGPWWASSTPARARSTPSCGATPMCSIRSSSVPRTSSSRSPCGSPRRTRWAGSRTRSPPIHA